MAGIAPSKEHVNVAPVTAPWNTNVPVVWFESAGGVESKAKVAATATPGAITHSASDTSSARTATPAATALRSTCGSSQTPGARASSLRSDAS